MRTAGVVLVRQRPGTGNAIFVTMEDETGVVNALLWARLFETFRREVMAARLMEVEGTVEKSVEGVLHVGHGPSGEDERAHDAGDMSGGHITGVWGVLLQRHGHLVKASPHGLAGQVPPLVLGHRRVT